MMLYIDLDTAKRLIAEAIALKGKDYVYVNPNGNRSICYNVHSSDDGETLTPGCIVGTALHLGGIPLDIMYDFSCCSAWELLDSLSNRGLLRYDYSAAEYLQETLICQDRGTPWGYAAGLDDFEPEGK